MPAGWNESREERKKKRERKRWEVSTILLIRSIYRRGTIYLRHVAARLRSPRSFFHSRLLATILVPEETIRFLHTRYYPRRNAHVHHVFFRLHVSPFLSYHLLFRTIIFSFPCKMQIERRICRKLTYYLYNILLKNHYRNLSI